LNFYWLTSYYRDRKNSRQIPANRFEKSKNRLYLEWVILGNRPKE
jgi:hypothetical protein